MAKRKSRIKEYGFAKGKYCPDCGRKVYHILHALPPHGLYVWIVQHYFTEDTCFHVEKDIPLSLKLDLMNPTNRRIHQW